MATSKSCPSFATVDPFDGMTGATPAAAQNLVSGSWLPGESMRDDIPDPMSGDAFVAVPDTQDIAPFLQSLASCPKTGLHNPLKNTHRYVHLGRVCARAAALLAEDDVEELALGHAPTRPRPRNRKVTSTAARR